MTDHAATAGDRDTAIEVLAERWLAAERAAAEQSNAGKTEDRARLASAAYDDAIATASAEDLLLAWHAARQRQDATEMGSKAWAEARSVSELLRMEYLARG